MRTAFAVSITTGRGVRRYLGRGRLFGRSALGWRRHRSSAELFADYATADRAARIEARRSALAAAVTVHQVDALRGRHRWHALATWEATAAGAAVPIGEETGLLRQVRVGRHATGGDR